MRKILVLLLLIFLSVAIQAGLVIAESENGTLDSKLPEITIINPSGGEEYSPEDVALISFEVLEDLFAEEPIEPVNILFYFDEQHNPAYDVSLPAADLLYEYDWSVPAELSDNVQLKVSATDYFGNVGEGNSQSFMIIDLAADFEADLTEGHAPLEVQFSDLSTGNITIWHWDFQNDGIIDSYEQNPQWTYEEAGIYSVSLTVANDQGRAMDTELKIDYIVVNELPVNNVHNITQNTWFATIQGGIDNSADFDTLIVNPGTYYENINFNGKAVTLGSFFYTTQDESYISQTVINGNQNGSVVVFNSVEDSTSVLCGFTITNGLADYGGGITCNNSSPTLAYIIISGNSAEDSGGGTCIVNSAPTLTNVEIRWNMAEYFGGGFYCYDSESTLLDVTIFDNQANSNGGGIYCAESSPILTNMIISYNSSGDSGGGIYCLNSEPILSEVTIYNNTTYNGRGGGLYCNYSTATLSDMTIYGNSAEYGGGISFYGSNLIMCDVIIRNNTTNMNGGGIDCQWSTPILTNVIIKENSAWNGGGLYCFASEPILTNVAITGNSASNTGGGIICSHSSPTLGNATIADNSAGLEGGGVFCSESSNPLLVNSILWNNSPQEICFNSEYLSNSIIVSHSDIAGGSQAIATNNNGVIFWLEENIDENPFFIDPDNGDYNLMEDSPCIDSGTAYFEYGGEVIINLSEDDYFGNAPDMGAYESGYYGINADFEADLTEGYAPLEVQFSDLSSGNITSWQWDFQDDGIIDSDEQNPLWTYTEPGVYSVSLTISNDIARDTATEIKTDYITVTALPLQIDLPDEISFNEDENTSLNLEECIDNADFQNTEVSWTGNEQVIIENSGMLLELSAALNWYGSEMITITVRYNEQTASDSVMISVNPVNDPPEINLPDSLYLDALGSMEIDLLDYTSDVEGDPLLFTAIVPQELSVNISGSLAEITAAVNWTGAAQLSFCVNDETARLTVCDSVTVIKALNPCPEITSITDIPADQGGKVLVQFAASCFDTDSLIVRPPQSYTVQLLYDDLWTAVNSTAAYGAESYQIMVNTIQDSIPDDPAQHYFRVIAAMEQGNFASNVSSGYSVDNIAPQIPEDLSFDSGFFVWNEPQDDDFAYFSVYLEGELFINTTLTQISVIGEIGNFQVAAVDCHYNQSELSAPVMGGYPYGDIDNNYAIEAMDASLVLQYFCLFITDWEEWQQTIADVDANGSIEAYDAALILRYVTGYIDHFPAETITLRKEIKINK